MGHGETPGQPVSKLVRRKQEREIVALKEAGLSFEQIGERLGIGRSTAHRRFYDAINRIPAGVAEDYRNRQLARIAMEREVVMDILAARHVTISDGHIVRDEGKSLEDDGPTLAAVDRLIKLDDQEAKLLGAYQPARVDTSVTVNYTVGGVDGGVLS